MDKPGPTPPPKPPPPPGRPLDRQALVEAYEQVVRTEKEKKLHEHDEPPRPRPKLVGWVLRLGLIAALGAIAFIRPSWLFTPAPPPEPTAVQEASLRMMIYEAATHIESFRARNQRLPESAREAGAEKPSVVFQPTGPSSYTLKGTSGEISLTYDSSQPLQDFVGNSYQVISERFRRKKP